MSLHLRPFVGDEDVRAAAALLRARLLANPGAGGVHPGDLNWWYYYNPRQMPFFIAEDSAGQVLGWCVLDSAAGEFDFFGVPGPQQSAIESALLDWCSDHLLQRDPARRSLSVCFTYTDDAPKRQFLEAQGYQASPFLAGFSQRLDALPEPLLPPGFRFLEAMHADYAAERARAHAAAFAPTSRMTPDYYRIFMQAIDYDPAFDVVVLAPDGRIAAYAMTWPDPASGIGEFEPVGTHPDFQRQGLGRAALLEGMRRLRACGHHEARVMAAAENTGNITFYGRAGFTRLHDVWMYTRML